MLISYKHKFIFIHNYKVAGSSITKTLEKYGTQDPTFNKQLQKIIEHFKLKNFKITNKVIKILKYHKTEKFPGHITAKELKKIIPEKTWNDFFKFGFVRNPWDWHVSLYYYILQYPKHFRHKLIKSMNSLEEYIEWRINNDKKLQKDFFYDDNNNCLVDFIGKFENINNDFQKICNKIGIKAKLPHTNKSKRKRNYREYYNEHTKNLIAKHFQEDIKTFNYSF